MSGTLLGLGRAPDGSYIPVSTDILSGGGTVPIPGQFHPDDWTLTNPATGGSLIIGILALPTDNGEPLTQLRYQVNGGPSVPFGSPAPGQYAIFGLTNGVTVNITIYAVNNAGSGAPSAPKTSTPTLAATVPAAPSDASWTLTNPVAVAGGQLNINLNSLPDNGGSALTTMQYQVGSNSWVNFPATIGVTPITGLTDGQQYSVAIRAVNAIGNSNSSPSKVQTPTKAAAIPDQFATNGWSIADAVSASGGQANITITTLPAANGASITSVQYQIGAGAYVTLPGLTGTFLISGFVNGTPTNVNVRAVNSVGNGPASATKSVTTSTAATRPATFVDGMWTLTDAASNGVATLNILTMVSDGGSPITNLQYRVNVGTWLTLPGGLGTGPRNITGLSNGVSQGIQIRAVNAVNAGQPSDTKFVTPTDAVPVATSNLPAQMYEIGVLITPLNVASQFTGTNIIYSLDPTSVPLPTGLTLSSAGVISGVPTSELNAGAVKVLGTNTGGNAVSTVFITSTAFPVITPIDLDSAVDPAVFDFSASEVGTLFWLVDTNATRTAAQVAAGGGNKSGFMPIDAGLSEIVTDLSGMADGNYFYHFCEQDYQGAFSVVTTVPLVVSSVVSDPVVAQTVVVSNSTDASAVVAPYNQTAPITIGNGPNKMLVAIFSFTLSAASATKPNPTATFGAPDRVYGSGQALTIVGNSNTGTTARPYVVFAYLLNPPPGIGTIQWDTGVVVMGSNSIIAVEVENVRQTIPILQFLSGFQLAVTNYSLSFTPASPGELVLAAIGLDGGAIVGGQCDVSLPAIEIAEPQTGSSNASDSVTNVAKKSTVSVAAESINWAWTVSSAEAVAAGIRIAKV